MIIDGQIRDEKLEYDINREAAKISALSSNKIGTYEFLTDEEILPHNQKQLIEQAKFIYSHLEKAFGKQIKTIEDQGEKQNQVQVKTIKKYTYDKEDTPLISKQKQIFNELADKRLDKITEKVNSDNLIYRYKGRTADAKFNEFDNALDLIDKTKE